MYSFKGWPLIPRVLHPNEDVDMCAEFAQCSSVCLCNAFRGIPLGVTWVDLIIGVFGHRSLCQLHLRALFKERRRGQTIITF